MGRRKYEDLSISQKYRCWCGCIHVQTLTIILCVLFFLNNAHEAWEYFTDCENDSWECFKIIYGLVASIGPLIGIKKKKTSYFLPFFFSPIIRFFYYSMILFSLFAAKILPNTPFGKKINDIFSDDQAKEVERILKKFPMMLFLMVVIITAFALEIWVYWVVYKCSKYITAMSLQSGGYGQQAKKHSNLKIDNLQTTSSLLEAIKMYTGYVVIEWLFFSKKTTPSDVVVKQQPKTKTLAIKNVEPQVEAQSPKAEETIQLLKDVTTKLKSEESYLTVQLKNPTVQTKAAENFSIKLKSAEKVLKNVKRQQLPPYKTKTLIKPKTADVIQNLKIEAAELQPFTLNLQQKNPTVHSKEAGVTKQLKIEASELKPMECTLNVHQKNPTVQSKVADDFVIKLKSTEICEKVVIKLSSPKKPFINTLSTSEASKKSHFHKPSIPTSSTPKKLVSIEIQTDETSFNQNIAIKKQQLNDFGYDSEAYSNNINPKSFSSFICDKYCDDQKSPITTSSGFASVSDADFSPNQTVSPNSEPSYSSSPDITDATTTFVTFLFKNDETFAVEVYKNGKKEKIKNVFDNTWTPLYFSMARPSPEIGETAQIHCHQFREHVLYDIFKVIGKSLNEIIIDPEWKFKIVEKNGTKCFQIQTLNGIRLFPEHIIVATFLKIMKEQAETYLNIKIHEIYVSSNFDIIESQKLIFKNAAFKVDLKILSFSVINEVD